jgi:hypothetical protein
MSSFAQNQARGNRSFLGLLDPAVTGRLVREKQSPTSLRVCIDTQNWPACSIHPAQRNTAHRESRSIGLSMDKTCRRPNSQVINSRFKNSCAPRQTPDLRSDGALPPIGFRASRFRRLHRWINLRLTDTVYSLHFPAMSQSLGLLTISRPIFLISLNS